MIYFDEANKVLENMPMLPPKYEKSNENEDGGRVPAD